MASSNDSHSTISSPLIEKPAAKPTPGAATSSPWNSGPFAFAPNTNVLDTNSMPSTTADAARSRTADIMAALKSGEPGAADKMMGDFDGRSAAGGLTGFGKLMDKFTKKESKELKASTGK